jgi:hypothetical protein
MKKLVKNFNQFILEKRQEFEYSHNFEDIKLNVGDTIPNLGVIEKNPANTDMFLIDGKYIKKSTILGILEKYFTELFQNIQIGSTIIGYGEITEITPSKLVFGDESVHKAYVYTEIIEKTLKGKNVVK